VQATHFSEHLSSEKGLLRDWVKEEVSLKKVVLVVLSVVILVLGAFAFLYKEPLPPIKVGVLHSLSGTMAISETPVMQATLLAIEHINATGGLLGRTVEAVVVDGKSDPKVFAKQAEHLIVDEKVGVVFGCWTSASRKTVKPIFEKYHNLLFYPVQYEGLEQSSNIIYTGAVPNQQIFPAVRWSMEHFGSRIYLIGSDYVFPHVANWLIHKQTDILRGTVVGERYIPLGSQNMDAVVADIRKFKPDVILNTINGDSNIAFFHALKKSGIEPQTTPVMSFSVGETELQQLSAGDGVGHYAAWSYFQSIDNPINKEFVSMYQATFGADKPVSDPMEAAWVGVHLWADAIRTAHTDALDVIQKTIVQQSMQAAEGVMSIDHQTRHTWKTSRIGRIRADHQFELVWSSHEPIRPYPYPALVSKRQAGLFLQKLYNTWHGHWSAPNATIVGVENE